MDPAPDFGARGAWQSAVEQLNPASPTCFGARGDSGRADDFRDDDQHRPMPRERFFSGLEQAGRADRGRGLQEERRMASGVECDPQTVPPEWETWWNGGRLQVVAGQWQRPSRDGAMGCRRTDLGRTTLALFRLGGGCAHPASTPERRQRLDQRTRDRPPE